ncbi:ROK family transcriptional regulator [Novosphingobium rosa]|uniref:ROK family transcriptional regulator n=1 Tax=Novosphingobium rosa TaxID=76978 RepID=UPI00082F7E86|nr:ROK family transcriptional regulator [Novosphingobium rosa]
MIERATRLAGANIEHAGRHNARVVLQVIRADGPITRSRIAARTGLTTATVTNITNRLLDEGLLSSVGQLRGGRGQPAVQLEVRAEGAFALGLNIDRDHLTLVAVDFAGTVRARISEHHVYPGPDHVEAFVARHIEALLVQGQVRREALVGMGVAVPDDLGILSLPGYPADHDDWSSVDVEHLLAPLVKLPISVENDAAAAAIGEMQFGLGQNLTRFFHLLLTFALGGGVVTNGFYDRGADGRSGEIGFLLIDDGHGGRIPLQSIVSLAGLSAFLVADGHGEEAIRALDDPALAGTLERWIARSARALVEPLIAVNCLLNPQAVLFGGRLPMPVLQRLIGQTQRELDARAGDMPTLAPVRIAALAEDAAAVGGALLAFGDLLLPAEGGAAPVS